MGQEILLVIITGLMWATIGVIFSRIANNNTDYVSFMSFTMLLTAILTWLIFPKYNILITHPAPPKLLNLSVVMLITGIISAYGMTAMNIGMEMGHHGATWIIAQSALIIPFVFGIILWHDNVRVINILGLSAIIAEIVLLGTGNNSENKSKKKNAGKWLFVSLLSLLLLGLQQTTASLPSRWDDWHDIARMRIPFYILGSFIGYCSIMLWQKKKLLFTRWRLSIVVSFLALVSNVLIFKALDIFAASSRAALVFPLTIGICTSAFSIYSIAILKEKTSFAHILGMVIGCTGIILVAIK